MLLCDTLARFLFWAPGAVEFSAGLQAPWPGIFFDIYLCEFSVFVCYISLLNLYEAPIIDRDYLVEQINSTESGSQVKVPSCVHEND